jgi:hypothetical protein
LVCAIRRCGPTSPRPVARNVHVALIQGVYRPTGFLIITCTYGSVTAWPQLRLKRDRMTLRPVDGPVRVGWRTYIMAFFAGSSARWRSACCWSIWHSACSRANSNTRPSTTPSTYSTPRSSPPTMSTSRRSRFSAMPTIASAPRGRSRFPRPMRFWRTCWTKWTLQSKGRVRPARAPRGWNSEPRLQRSPTSKRTLRNWRID